MTPSQRTPQIYAHVTLHSTGKIDQSDGMRDALNVYIHNLEEENKALRAASQAVIQAVHDCELPVSWAVTDAIDDLKESLK